MINLKLNRNIIIKSRLTEIKDKSESLNFLKITSLFFPLQCWGLKPSASTRSASTLQLICISRLDHHIYNTILILKDSSGLLERTVFLLTLNKWNSKWYITFFFFWNWFLNFKICIIPVLCLSAPCKIQKELDVLEAAHKYGIHIQSLPLMCSAILLETQLNQRITNQLLDIQFLKML